MGEKKSERLFLVAIIVSMCIWGFSWSSAKVLSGYGKASSIAFIRFLIVMVSLFFVVWTLKLNFKIKKSGLPYVFGAGIFLIVYSWVFFSGLQVGLAGAGGILITTSNPIFAYLIGLVISKTVPGKKEIGGLFIGLAAGAVLLHIWTGTEGLFDIGNILFLLAGFLWAGMSKFSSKSSEFGNEITFVFWMHVLTSIGFLPFVDFNDVNQIIETGDSKFWLNMLYFGVINSAIATTCYLYATSRLGAEKASSFVYLVPSAGLLGSWLFLNETIHLHTVIGGALGVLAVFIINKKSKTTV